MAEGARSGARRGAFPRARTFGTAAATARGRLAMLWSRESILRLLLSVVLATALWLYVTGKETPAPDLAYNQPLGISTANVPDGMTVTNNLGAVHVRIRLSDRNVLVTPASFHVFVTLSHRRPGTYPRVPVQVIADPGIQVVRVTPSHVPVLLERLQTVHVPVRWDILNHPPAGYTLGDVQVDPSTVTVSGPESVVSQVAQATVFIDTSQARSSVEGTYKAAAENSQGEQVVGRLLIDPQQVRVVVPVKPLTSYKTLPVLVPIRGQPKRGFGVASVVVQPAEINVRGAPARVSRLLSVYTAPISVNGKGSGNVTQRLRLQTPKGIQAGSSRVWVTIQIHPVSASTSVEVAVAPINVAPGLIVHTRPASVLVTLVGPASALQAAGRSMRAVISLSGDGIGAFDLTPVVTAPKGVHVAGVYPSTVTVQVAPR